MVGFQGREHQWDIEVDGVPFRCVRDENGVPDWSSQSTPEVANRAVQIADETDNYSTWHLGFGYSHKLIEGAYHYSSGGVDCLPGYTTVRSLMAIRAASRRWYEGDIVHITTAGGNQVRATPNHPILTGRGWVPIGLLKEGDNVVRYPFSEHVGAQKPDVQDTPPTIEEIFDALTDTGLVQRVPSRTDQFHGDGLADGKVDIVTVHGELRDGFDVASLQPGLHLSFALADEPTLPLSSRSALTSSLKGFRLAPPSLKSMPRDLAVFIERALAGDELVSGSTASSLNTGLDESAPDDRASKSHAPGDGLLGLTCEVRLDQIVSVQHQAFRGHVYNLHTDNGWYATDGIIAHNCRFPRQITMGPLVTILGLTGAGVYDSSNYDSSAIYGGSADGNVVGFFEQSSTLYILASRYVQRIDLGSDSYWTANGAVDGKDFGATKACTSAVNFDASTVVGMGNTEGVWTFDGTTWDQATDQTPDIAAGYLAKAYLETFFALARTFTSSSEPVIDWISEGSTIDSTSWGADYNIGDRAAAVTGLASFAEKWFVAKTDGLYATDRTGRMPCVVPLRSIVSTNGQNVTVDSMGYVWFPTIEGYYRYDSSNGEVIDCSPGRALPNASPIYGRITAHVQYKGWWYCSVYNGTDSYIMVGRERENGEPGVGPMVWHGALCKVANEAINCMHVTGLVTPPRLYFGAGSAVGYIRLPLTADNPLLDSYYRYASSGSIYLSASNWGVPGTGWYLSAIEMECKNLTTTTYINVYAKLNNGNWQHIQKVDVAGSVTVTMPKGDSWLFGECSLRLDFTNSDSALTPIVTSIVARATRRVAVSDLISTTLLCSNRVLSRYDIQTRLSGKEQLGHLKALSTRSPVIASDWWTGSKRDLTVLVMPVTERIVREPREDAVDMAASVTLRVLSEPDAASYIQAQNVGIYDQSVYDGNDTYGGVRVRVFTQ